MHRPPGLEGPWPALRQAGSPCLRTVVNHGGSSLRAVDQLRRRAMCGGGWSTDRGSSGGGLAAMTSGRAELRALYLLEEIASTPGYLQG